MKPSGQKISILGWSIKCSGLSTLGRYRFAAFSQLKEQRSSASKKARGWCSAFLQHLTWQELQQCWAAELADAVSLAAVRNPWARFASVFTNTDTHLKLMAKHQGVELEGLSFSAFVEATEDLEHAHLRAQRDYLVDEADVLIVPNLLRAEVLGQDFDNFCVQHGIKAELPWANRSCELIPYEQHYCPSSWQRIGERYSADVALWEELNK